MMGQSVLQQGHAPENLSGVLGCLASGVRMGRTALDTAGKQAEGGSQRSAMLCGGPQVVSQPSSNGFQPSGTQRFCWGARGEDWTKAIFASDRAALL